jgi:ribosomal protein L23
MFNSKVQKVNVLITQKKDRNQNTVTVLSKLKLIFNF